MCSGCFTYMYTKCMQYLWVSEEGDRSLASGGKVFCGCWKLNPISEKPASALRTLNYKINFIYNYNITYKTKCHIYTIIEPHTRMHTHTHKFRKVCNNIINNDYGSMHLKAKNVGIKRWFTL